MILRGFGILLIIASCGGLGFLIARSYYLERTCLQQWINALDYMQCELQYTLCPLPQLCRQVASQSGGKIRILFNALANELEQRLEPEVNGCMKAALKNVKDLPKQVYHAAEDLGNTLGRFDSEGQIRQIEGARQRSRNCLVLLEKDSQARTRCYQTLGLCTGAALAILLI